MTENEAAKPAPADYAELLDRLQSWVDDFECRNPATAPCAEAAAAIKDLTRRLAAGGCARDQHTDATQFCAIAVDAEARVKELEALVKAAYFEGHHRSARWAVGKDERHWETSAACAALSPAPKQGDE